MSKAFLFDYSVVNFSMVSFSKLTFFLVFSVSDMDIDVETTLTILSIIGNIPADAEYNVETNNNGKDAQLV